MDYNNGLKDLRAAHYCNQRDEVDCSEYIHNGLAGKSSFVRPCTSLDTTPMLSVSPKFLRS